MTRIANLITLAGCGALALALAGGCGGKSQSAGADEPSESGNNDSSKGNATATGGNSATNQGGASSGARDGDGGSKSTGATTNRAGSPSRAACDDTVGVNPHAPGGCAAAIPRWRHDLATGVCTPFIYGGCPEAENNYESLAACQEACPNNRPNNMDACAAASDCLVVLASCCGPSFSPGFTAHDFLAYNSMYQGQIEPCNYGVCEQATEELNAERRFFVPECVQKECRVTDLRTSELTRCETAQDCRLRMGSGCCEGCGELIAVRNDGSFEKQICGDTLPPCPPCVGTMPPDFAVPVCIEGHCSVAYDVEL